MPTCWLPRISSSLSSRQFPEVVQCNTDHVKKKPERKGVNRALKAIAANDKRAGAGHEPKSRLDALAEELDAFLQCLAVWPIWESDTSGPSVLKKLKCPEVEKEKFEDAALRAYSGDKDGAYDSSLIIEHWSKGWLVRLQRAVVAAEDPSSTSPRLEDMVKAMNIWQPRGAFSSYEVAWLEEHAGIGLNWLAGEVEKIYKVEGREAVGDAQGERLEWKCTATAFAYIFNTLAGQGYVDPPPKGAKSGDPNYTELARILLQSFVVIGGRTKKPLTAAELSFRMSPSYRPLPAGKRRLITIPPAKELM